MIHDALLDAGYDEISEAAPNNIFI